MLIDGEIFDCQMLNVNMQLDALLAVSLKIMSEKFCRIKSWLKKKLYNKCYTLIN